MKDPLHAFLHEKVAADAPTTQGGARHFTLDPDRKSQDPGERAFAALMAATGGTIVSKIAPMLGGMALRVIGSQGVSGWPHELPTSAKTIHEITSTGGTLPGGKLLGLWNVQSKDRIRRAENAVGAAAEKLTLTREKLDDMQGVVDSFIHKNKLSDKGVRINMHQGPLSFLGGNRYDPLTKQVFLPSLSKEQVLHELGHAADATGSRLGRFRNLADPIIQRGAMIALPMALIAGDAIKERIPGTIDDKAIEFMQDHAPAIMGATMAATSLYPEAKASFLAYKHTKEVEGPAAARAALKRFIPMWGTYLLGAVPAVVGMSLAKKYMQQAREEKEHSKVAGVALDTLKDIGHGVADHAADVWHIGKQVGRQTLNMLSEPGLASRVGRAAKEVGTSPEFVYGAMSAGVPAALGSLYLYGTPAGKVLRERIHPEHHDTFATVNSRAPLVGRASEKWREENPARFAGLVAAGAALSGGIIAKFLSDLQRVI